MSAVPGGIPADLQIPVADYVAFDLETTGLSPETDEILEVAMVRFSGGYPAERWSSLVNPGKNVPLKTLRLTHIDPAELLASPPLRDLLAHMQEFRGSFPLVGHNSAFDAAFVARQVAGFPGVPIYDTLELARITVPGFKSYKLADLARELGVPSVEAHRAYDDAEVSGVIFRLIQAVAMAMPERTRTQVLSVMGAGWGGAPVFAARTSAAPAAIAARPSRKSPSRAAVAAAQPSLFDQPLPELREIAPRDAVLALRDALRSPLQDLFAGTVAVSAANLPLTPDVARAIALEAREHASSEGKRALLLGFPRDAIPAGAVRAGSAEDYLCLARLEEAVRQADDGAYANLDSEQRCFLAGLFQWAEMTEEGALAELQMGSGGYAVAPEVACPPSMGCRKSCPRAPSCFYVRSLSRGEASRPGADRYVSFATIERGLRLGARAGVALVWGSQDIARAWQGGEPRVDLAQLKDALRRAGFPLGGGSLAESLQALSTRAAADMQAGGIASEETCRLAASFAGEVEAAAAALRDASRTGSGAKSVDLLVDPPLVWRDLRFVEKCAADLRRFLGGISPEGAALRLVEQSYGDDAPRGPVLVGRAVWPVAGAARAICQGARTVVLLSDIASAAYGSEGGKRAFGLDLSVGAPVDLGPTAHRGSLEAGPLANVLMLVVDPGWAVTTSDYAEHLRSVLSGLAPRVRKGLLATFPSRALLRQTYSAVAPDLEAQGIAVYGQGIDGGHRVVEHLDEDDALVLTMAGGGPSADDPVPSCLVLARVPFAPPNPLDEARRKDMASCGRDGFVEVNVRPAALSLRSYVEKMAKSGKKCAVVLADPKLLPRRSSWGPEFMSAFRDLTRLTCPEREVLSRVGEWVRG